MLVLLLINIKKVKQKNQLFLVRIYNKTPKYEIYIKMEGLAGFEPANQGFADPCLTAWLQTHDYLIVI